MTSPSDSYERRMQEIRDRLKKAKFAADGLSMHVVMVLLKDDMPWLLSELESALQRGKDSDAG